MKKNIAMALVALSLAGCAGKPLLSGDTKVQTGIYDCSNAKTGATDTLTVEPGKIYLASQGMKLREVQSTRMSDGTPLVKYQRDFAVWYTSPEPILTHMRDSRFRLACVKKV